MTRTYIKHDLLLLLTWRLGIRILNNRPAGALRVSAVFFRSTVVEQEPFAQLRSFAKNRSTEYCILIWTRGFLRKEKEIKYFVFLVGGGGGGGRGRGEGEGWRGGRDLISCRGVDTPALHLLSSQGHGGAPRWAEKEYKETASWELSRANFEGWCT